MSLDPRSGLRTIRNASVDAPRQLLMLLVRTYRILLRPVLGNRCRFAPTCSEYALEALRRHGAAAGSGLAVYRLIRCNPLCAGGHDPVPDSVSPFKLRSKIRP